MPDFSEMKPYLQLITRLACLCKDSRLVKGVMTLHLDGRNMKTEFVISIQVIDGEKKQFAEYTNTEMEKKYGDWPPTENQDRFWERADAAWHDYQKATKEAKQNKGKK